MTDSIVQLKEKLNPVQKRKVKRGKKRWPSLLCLCFRFDLCGRIIHEPTMLCPAVSTLGSLWKFRLNNARAAKKGTSKTCDRGQDDCSFGEKGHDEMCIASSLCRKPPPRQWDTESAPPSVHLYRIGIQAGRSSFQVR